EVDRVDAEAPEAGLACFADVLGAAADAADHAALPVAHDAELGGDHDPLAPAAQRAAHQLLGGVGTVHVGGVEEVHAEREPALDGGERFRLVAGTVDLRHPHAPEAERGHLEPELPEPSSLHEAGFTGSLLSM